MRSRLLVLSLLPVTAVAVGLAPAEGGSATAAGTAPAAKAKRMVVSPRAGRVVRSHHVRLRVRSRGLSGVLRVRLNGVQVGDDFGRPRRGVRTLRASVSHGLRRGRNVLRVSVRRRGRAPGRATVRFFVRTKRPLVGAGRDRRVVIGSRTRLYGQVKQIMRRGGRRAARSKVRWKLVGGPRRGRVRAASADTTTTPPATLTSPAGLTAGFLPMAPGSYTLQLTHGAGQSATTDRVTLDAVPPSPLVPIDTMVSTNASQRGIRVGDTTYLLRDAAGSEGTYYQVLVLDRKTLGFVWNRKYYSASALGNDLNGLKDTELVIVVQQPGNQPGDIGELNDVVGRIGVPDYGQLPKGPGLVSAIGVPGMARGDADVNVVPDQRFDGRMQGYLSPDQYSNYGYVPSQRYAFNYGGKEVDPCTAGTAPPCDNVGYRLNVKYSRSFEARPGDNRVYNTGGRGLTAAQQTAEANRMADDLNAVASDDVVTIQTVGSRRAGETSYPAPIGAVDKATMKKLALAVARVGGTRDAFNRAALVQGKPASGGAVYSLAGWVGAPEGEGAEVGAGVDGAGDAPMLSFVLRPDRQSRLRPAQATNSNTNTDALSGLMLKPPTTAWPLDDDPGARKAIAYLGTKAGLDDNPRRKYWTQRLDQSDTNSINKMLDLVAYPDGSKDFTLAEFTDARNQLETELLWVGKVRKYLKNLSGSFDDNALPSWVAAQTIGDDIYKDVNKPDDQVAFRWIQFTEIMLHLLGPFTDGASAYIASALQLGAWAYGAHEGGSPSDQEVRDTADKLGALFVEQAQQAQATLLNIGDVIVSDYAKLSKLGPCAGYGSADCPKEFALSGADQVAASKHLYTSIRQMAYAELLPLAYHVFALTRHCNETDCDSDGLTPPDPGKYNCQGYHPWSGYPRAASTSLLQELDPGGIHRGWRTFVLSVPPGATTTQGKPPSDKLLSDAFGPIDPAGDPKKGGAGLSLAQLALEKKLDYWYHNPDKEWSSCKWDG
jgi:hypothetical protein